MAESVDPENKSNCDLELRCDLCRLDDEKVAAESFCVDCLDCLCKKCVDSHSGIEVYKNHTIIHKDKLPLNTTRDILKALKDVIICSVHESQFDYFCEDHAKLICHACIRKGHRNCKSVKQLQSTIQVTSSEIQAIGIRQETLKQQKEEQVKAILDEKRHQDEVRSSILSNIQHFLEHFDNIKEKETQVIVSSVRDEENINRTLCVAELLRVVSILNDEKKRMVVAKYAQLELAKQDTSSVENDRIKTIKCGVTDMSKRLEMLSNITTELFNTKIYSVDEEKGYVDIRKVLMDSCLPQTGISVQQPIHLCSDAEVQTEPCVNIDGIQVQEFSSNTQTTASSDPDTEPCQTQVISNAFRDVEIQTDACIGYNVDSRKSCGKTTAASRHCNSKSPCVVSDDHRSQSPTLSDPGKKIITFDNSSQTSSKDIKHDERPLLFRSLEFSGTYNVCQDGETTCFISDIVVLQSRQVVVIDSENLCMKVFDEFFSFQKSCTFPCKPFVICTVETQKSEIVAVSFVRRIIQTYKIHGSTIEFYRKLDLSLYPRGMCSVSRNTLMVLMSDIEIMNRSGFNKVNSVNDRIQIQYRDVTNGRIVGAVDSFEREIQNPLLIIKDQQNNIIMNERDRVSAYDTNGSCIWYYKSKKDNFIDGVSGLTIDPEGNVYACGLWSNNIHQVSSFDYRRSRVIVPNVPPPWSIIYDPHHERLIIGCNKCTSVYVYRFI